MEKIKALRSEIDAIDDTLIPLLIKRFTLSREIGVLKKQAEIHVLDRQREHSILQKIPHSPYQESLIELYSLLFTLSKKHQEMT